MAELLNQGLIITAIGMGLVFIAIIFLWGLMALMVRIGMKPEKAGQIIHPDEPSVPGTVVDKTPDKFRAAAAAVAMALAQQSKKFSVREQAETDLKNTWQPVQRAQVLQEKSRVFAQRTIRRN